MLGRVFPPRHSPTLSLTRRLRHSWQKPLIRAGHLGPSLLKNPPMSEHRPPTPEDAARHVDKRPRLSAQSETDLQPEVSVQPGCANVAPVDAMMVDATKPEEPVKAATKKRQGPKKRKNKKRVVEPYSNEHLLYLEIKSLLGEDVVATMEKEGRDAVEAAPFSKGTVLELTVTKLSPTGTSVSCFASAVEFMLLQASAVRAGPTLSALSRIAHSGLVMHLQLVFV